VTHYMLYKTPAMSRRYRAWWSNGGAPGWQHKRGLPSSPAASCAGRRRDVLSAPLLTAVPSSARAKPSRPVLIGLRRPRANASVAPPRREGRLGSIVHEETLGSASAGMSLHLPAAAARRGAMHADDERCTPRLLALHWRGRAPRGGDRPGLRLSFASYQLLRSQRAGEGRQARARFKHSMR